jgi:hypothetical protein
LRSSGLVRMKVSLTRVFQSGLKTGGGATMGSACGTIAEVASEEVEDGRVDVMDCVGPCYPTFTVFNVLGHRSILVI